MNSLDLQRLERRLQRAIPPTAVDPTFARRLRRALLNAPHWQEPWGMQWLPRAARSLPLAGVALAAGFFVAVGLSGKSPTAPVGLPAATMISPVSLQQLSQSGRLHFSHQQPNGVRIYQVDLTDGQTLELWDAVPYAIRRSNQTP